MKILYFGPIAEKGKPAIGGYEAANRKNIDALRNRGIEVIEYRNPTINKKWGLLGKFAYLKLFLYVLVPLKYVGRKDVIAHTTYLHSSFFMLPNAMLSWMMRLCKIKNVLDVRAGSTVELYEHANSIYKYLMRITVECATVVTVEGKKYLNAIPQMTGIEKPMFYFPNLYDCSQIKMGEHNPPATCINLFYFGAIKESKGIPFLLDLISILEEKFHLYLAGNIETDMLRSRIEKTDRVHYLGKLNKDELKNEMQKMHFFVFPTMHIGEGQSNSLIEAMGEGLIPVTSSKGFCSDVVADCGSVLPLDATAEDYKEEILRWTIDSDIAAKRCQQHIIQHHNLNTEIDRLIDIYKSL